LKDSSIKKASWVARGFWCLVYGWILFHSKTVPLAWRKTTQHTGYRNAIEYW